jgi:hypothetical protein
VDTATLILVSYLLGLATGVFLMGVSIRFVQRQIGATGEIGVTLPFGIKVERAPQAMVIFLAGAFIFGGTLYWAFTQVDDSPPAAEFGKIDVDLISASASSVHPTDRGITYSARNTLDGNPNSAWNADGSGVGERLHYEFSRPTRLRRIQFINGYAKDPVTFARNARLRDITIITDERIVRRTLKSTMRWQTLEASFGVTRLVTIEIDSIYPGDRPGWNDAAVTEIAFWGMMG